MREYLSLSIFTIEADRKPILAVAAKKHHEAEAFIADERIKTKLRSVRSGGAALCDDRSILRVRMAHSDERARYNEQIASRSSVGRLEVVFLVDVDESGLERQTSENDPEGVAFRT